MKKSNSVTAEIVRIGNSHGVRIPKAIREQAGLTGRVTMTVADNALVIRAERKPREGWEEAIAKVIAEHGHDEPVWPDYMQNDFDDTEWTW
jgi:antitoxin MazE